MIYNRQANDMMYRLVNLKLWDQDCQWQEFSRDVVDNSDRYVILELQKRNGNTEIRDTGIAKEKVFWKITKDGKITITFFGEKTVREGPFLGHMYLTSSMNKYIKYFFPRIKGEKNGNKLECIFQIKKNASIDSLLVEGDEYFRQVFILEKQA